LVFPFNVGLVLTTEKNAVVPKEILWLQMILAITLQDVADSFYISNKHILKY